MGQRLAKIEGGELSLSRDLVQLIAADFESSDPKKKVTEINLTDKRGGTISLSLSTNKLRIEVKHTVATPTTPTLSSTTPVRAKRTASDAATPSSTNGAETPGGEGKDNTATDDNQTKRPKVDDQDKAAADDEVNQDAETAIANSSVPKLIVEPLPEDVTKEQIIEKLSKFGRVENVTLDESKKSAHVYFDTIEATNEAVHHGHNTMIFNDNLRTEIKFAEGDTDQVENQLIVWFGCRDVTETHLTRLFSQVGHVRDIRIMSNKGLAFLSFDTRAQAQAAIDRFNKKTPAMLPSLARPLQVRFSDHDRKTVGGGRAASPPAKRRTSAGSSKAGARGRGAALANRRVGRERSPPTSFRRVEERPSRRYGSTGGRMSPDLDGPSGRHHHMLDSPPRARPGYYDDLEFRSRGGGAPSFDDLSGAGLIPVHSDRLIAAANAASASSSSHHLHHSSLGEPLSGGGGWDYPLVSGKTALSGSAGGGGNMPGGAYATNSSSSQQSGLYQSQQTSMYGLSATGGAFDLSAAASAQQLGYGTGGGSGTPGAAGSGAAASYMAYYYPRT